MNRTDQLYQAYLTILKEELVPASGCTEPIALAYAAALARQTLGTMPERVVVDTSVSIIKNVASVTIPYTGGLKGIPAAVLAGMIGGDPDKKLDVLTAVKKEQEAEILRSLDTIPVTVRQTKGGNDFEILITAENDRDTVRVHIVGYHTNVVCIEKNGKILFHGDTGEGASNNRTDRGLLNLRDIWEFATTCEIVDVQELLDRQISCNWGIAEEGMRNPYGANIGSVLNSVMGGGASVRAKAMAAAGSDARMNGCEMPVVTNSGSGNQGITVSVPVIVYAEELHATREQLYRALTLSNLIAIHEKTPIGTLSAYCGAVTAGAGAGAGIVYLKGGGFEEVAHTVVNTLAITSGIVCDGAKSSCAAKIASAVDAGLLGGISSLKGCNFHDGEGLVRGGAEQTIQNVGRLAREGMRETNDEIVEIILDH